jgi:hypothetical protein
MAAIVWTVSSWMTPADQHRSQVLEASQEALRSRPPPADLIQRFRIEQSLEAGNETMRPLDSPDGHALREVSVRIVDERHGHGLPDLEVRFWGDVTTKDRQRAHFRFTRQTDSRGEFIERIPEWSTAGSLAMVAARDASQNIVFYGTVPISERMVAIASSALTLHGRIDGLPFEFLDQHTLEVSAQLLSDGDPQGRFVGRGIVDRKGSFEVKTRTDLASSRSVHMTFASQSRSSDPAVYAFLVSRALTRDLLGDGARLVLDPGRVTVSVVDAATSEPLTECRLLCYGEDSLTGSASDVSLPRGLASLVLNAGRYTIYVSRYGYQSSGMTLVTATQSQLQFSLRRSEDDVIRGQVFGPLGDAIPDAIVSVTPFLANREIDDPVAVKSDAEGRYVLPMGSVALPARIRAFKKALGFSDAQAIDQASPAVYDLHFAKFGSASINVVSAAGIPGRSGQFEYFAYRVADRQHSVGRSWTPMLLTLGEGDYDVHLRQETHDLAGSATISVRAGEISVYDVFVEPASRVEVSVLDSDGAPIPGVRVRFSHPQWPDQLSGHWGTGVTDLQGRAGVFCGSLTNGTLQAVLAERTVAVPYLGGSAQTILCPAR